MAAPTSESKIVFLVGSVQFINILDFMMVSPLAPVLSPALGFDPSNIGAVVGAYTAAACVAGLVGALFLDRFDRRKALAVSLVGLFLGTAAGGLATNLATLMGARVLAGLFGGPATSIAMSIVADAIPAERRGKALGAVAGAFAVASVLGVPAGLKLADLGGWRMPFFAVAGLGVIVTAAALALLPPFRDHLVAQGGGASPRSKGPTIADLFRRPVVLLSYSMTASVMLGTFALVPNLSSYFVFNLGYPGDQLGTLFLAGGILSFFATRVVGFLIDRHGAFRVGTAGSLWLIGVLYFGFVAPIRGTPVLALFLAFMLSNSLRSVPLNTLTSQVPAPAERARFMSIQSAVQHLASSLGGFLSTLMLRALPGGKLEGMAAVATFSMVLAALFPLLSRAVEARVAARCPPAPEPAPAS